MRIKREGIPEEGDIVLATITRIEPHAAFIRLEEYEGVEGLIHISEISKSWVKNIKSHLRVNQQVVCKVIRVKRQEKFVECSIRRVSEYDMRAKWEQVRRQKRAEAIIEIVAEKLGKKFEEVYEALKPLEKGFDELYLAFEEMKKRGKEVAKGKVPEKILDVLWEIVDRSVSLPRVSIKGILTLQSFAPDGVERIKKVLGSLKADVKYLGAPKYMLQVEGLDYKEAERRMAEILKKIEKNLTAREFMSFERVKK